MSNGPIAKFVHRHPWWSVVIVLWGIGFAAAFIPTNRSQPTPKSPPPAPSPTVANIYPSLLEKQIDRLKKMHSKFDKVRAARNKALDAGQSFTCRFTSDDISLEADTIDANKVIDAYRIRHADEIKTLLHANAKLKQLEASESELNAEVAAQEEGLKSICY